MRIGINCLTFDPLNVGGVTTYTLGLLRGLAAERGAHEIHIFIQPRYLSALKNILNSHEILIHSVRLPFAYSTANRAYFSNSRTVTRLVNHFITRRLAAHLEETVDLLYTPTTILTVYELKIPQVLSMHDIQHVHFPDFFRWYQHIARGIRYELSARYANAIQASSQFSKEDFLNFFSFLTEDSVFVIPEGVDVATFAAPRNIKAIIEKYKLPNHFLFYPAQLWKHKNHLTVLRALRWLRDNSSLDIPLVITGRRYHGSEEIFSYAESHCLDLYHLGNIPFDDLVTLFHASYLLIQAGLHESSSLPILEGCACSTAVIAARIPPIVEMAKTLDIELFSPTDPIDLAQQLARLWKDDARRAEMIVNNREQIIQFDWRVIARRYIKYFERIHIRHDT
ncbi:putative Glycosyltransferase [Gammaproteobacteria bacterium]